MSEFRESSKPLSTNESGVPLQGHQEGINVSKEEQEQILLDELVAALEEISPHEFDESKLNGILNELDTIAPMKVQFDAEASLKNFYEKNAYLLKDAPGEESDSENPVNGGRIHFRIPIRKLAVVAATIVIMLASMMTAQAVGIDVFGYFARWTDDVFYFMKDTADSPIEEAKVHVYPMEIGESQEFESLEAAVEAFGISAPIVPHWFPESLGETTVTGSITSNGMLVYEFSVDDTEEFCVDFSESSEHLIQKDFEDVQTYTKGGIIHYLMVDGTLRKATWINGDITCFISGHFSEQEMKQIINSIYEG